MAQATRYTGKALVMTIGAVNIGADYKTISKSEGINVAEATGGVDAHEYSIPTYKNGSLDVEIFGIKKADANYANVMAYTAPGSVQDLVYGPEGGTSGLPKFTAKGFVEKRSVDYKFDDTVTMKFTYRCNEAIAEGTY